MKNPMFNVPLNTNKLQKVELKDMPDWFPTVLDFINKIAETLYYAQEFDLKIFVKSIAPTGGNIDPPVFTVSTGAAGSDVVISGSYPNWNLQIPRGDTGLPGASAFSALTGSPFDNANLSSALNARITQQQVEGLI